MTRRLPATMRVTFALFLAAVVAALVIALFRGAMSLWWSGVFFATALVIVAAVRATIYALFRASETVDAAFPSSPRKADR